jgi:predicted AlkP superfamily phosphohydrolase/phosphomutase
VSNRVVVIGLDGVPHSLLLRLMHEGVMPEMAKLMGQGDLRAMDTVYPPLSSVSWTTFATGVTPGRHRIFGFFEAQVDDYGIWFQNQDHVKMPSLWDYTQAYGRRTISINLPGTYPAMPFNGVMISGFIARDLESSVYPSMLLPVLKKINYKLDVPLDDPQENPDRFFTVLDEVLNARAKTIGALLEHEPFDLFIGVFTETDRVHHYFFDALEEPHHPQRQKVYEFYRRIDAIVGQLSRLCRPTDELVILADHGFCRIEQEIFINQWLKENGYLVLKPTADRASLHDIVPEQTRAFSLDPGRIYLNVRGRQPHGCVEPEDVPALCAEIAAGLKALTIKVPWSSKPFAPITHVFRPEEIYGGPFAHLAADLVLHTADGFEMKGSMNSPVLHSQGHLTGMHTFGDAMLYIRGRRLKSGTPRMIDVPATLLHLLGLAIPKAMEGHSLV